MTIKEQITRLAEHRDRTLAKCSTAGIIEWIAATADLWRRSDSTWLERAAREGAAATGFSAPMIRLGLRDFFEGVNRSTLSAWLFGEIGGEPANGPRVVTHIFSGNVPNAAFQSLLSGLSVKAANVCKCASGDPLLPKLFVESLMEMDADLGRCVLFADWKGGDAEAERETWSVSDAVIVNGSDETIESVRRRLPRDVTLVAYGHRVSVACIAREKLTAEDLPALAEAAAYDVSLWDQHGCLSPHCIYVEAGGGVAAVEFAEALAVEMERFERQYPLGDVTLEEASAAARIHGAYEFRASSDAGVRVFGARNRGTVIFENEPMWATSCLNRLVFVKPMQRLEDLARDLTAVEGKLSCVGLAADESRVSDLAGVFARCGATRVCSVGQMQRPPLSWRRDGHAALLELMQRAPTA